MLKRLQHEVSTADNIKSRKNRHSVKEALTCLIEQLKLLKKIPDHGIALFSGEGQIYSLEPPRKIETFLYRCDKKFHWESIHGLFKEETKAYGIVLISGQKSEFYIIRGSGSKPELLSRITTELQSRQSRGGQSQNRIARLCEQKRDIYVKQIVEEINRLFLQTRKLIIGGPGELKDKVKDSELLDYRIKIISSIAINELNIEDFIVKHCRDVFQTEILQKERIIVEEVEMLCQTGSSKLIYGKDIDKYLDLIKKLIVYEGYPDTNTLPEKFNKEIIHISRSLPGAQLIKNLGGIVGILFYDLSVNPEDDIVD